ncbi:hypothetical protein ACFQFS_17535, partial [Novosphingobium lubricantis]
RLLAEALNHNLITVGIQLLGPDPTTSQSTVNIRFVECPGISLKLVRDVHLCKISHFAAGVGVSW